MLRTGALASHLQRVLIPTYQARSRALQRAIQEKLVPLGVTIDTGKPYVSGDDAEQVMEQVIGGFFIYIVFPEGVTADEVAEIALKDHNVKFLASRAMMVRGSERNDKTGLLMRGARLCWAWEEEQMLMEGVDRIATVLKNRFQ